MPVIYCLIYALTASLGIYCQIGIGPVVSNFDQMNRHNRRKSHQTWPIKFKRNKVKLPVPTPTPFTSELVAKLVETQITQAFSCECVPKSVFICQPKHMLTDDDPLLLVYRSSFPLPTKKNVQVGSPLTKISGSAHATAQIKDVDDGSSKGLASSCTLKKLLISV